MPELVSGNIIPERDRSVTAELNEGRPLVDVLGRCRVGALSG